MDLKVEYININDLVAYADNAKIHTENQIEQIKNSIKEFGMNDPIAIWRNNEIIEGHGRLLALKELGYETVPVIRLDSLTDEQRKAYAIAHNKLTMNTGFDFDLLSLELDRIELDMTDFGFTEAELLEMTVDDYEESGGKSQERHYDVAEEAKGETAFNGESDSYSVSDNENNVSKEELDLYEKKAETLVTKRVIIVYKTQEEEEKLKRLFGLSDEQQLNVVYNASDMIA